MLGLGRRGEGFWVCFLILVLFLYEFMISSRVGAGRGVLGYCRILSFGFEYRVC